MRWVEKEEAVGSKTAGSSRHHEAMDVQSEFCQPDCDDDDGGDDDEDANKILQRLRTFRGFWPFQKTSQSTAANGNRTLSVQIGGVLE